MLNKLRIGTRLVALILVQTFILGLVGTTGILGLRYAADTTASLNTNVIEQVKLNQLNETVRVDILDTINKLQGEKITWEQGRAQLLAAKNLFVNNWNEYKEDRSSESLAEVEASLGNEFSNAISIFVVLEAILELKDQQRLARFVETELPNLINPFITELNEQVNEQQLVSEQLFDASIEQHQWFLFVSAMVIALGLVIASLLGYFIYRSIARPIGQISQTVSKVSDGDYYARTKVVGEDELGALGIAFDTLLEDKVATLVQAEKDNETLNESVISLLTAVSKLSQRDLTIKVPVTEDVTGPVADALNQLTAETSRVLLGVRRISEEVARASAMVKSQSDNVIEVATLEQKDVEDTVLSLANAVNTMNNIVSLAQVCNVAAENAIETTHTALDTVNKTVEGIGGIRETIHETEKRIKRLGERSQEISRAVNLINSISERTHILALNASMHAASAGEAGRGFAVVADEVQRLAENARDATSQISSLVSNIQVETSDTVTTMNNVISQVVEGSRLAEQAGKQMRKTQESTTNLVDSVRQIAKSSQDQARVSNELQSKANQIQESTKKTRDQLHAQTQQTTRLVEYARGLLKAVQVFKLPKLEAPASQPKQDTAPAKAKAKPLSNTVSLSEVAQKKAS